MLRAKKTIRTLEKRFIARSNSAFVTAYKRSRASGQPVVVSEDGLICEISPDGSRKVLKRVEPPTRVRAGLKVTIR
jgi:hypothetical protein